MKLLELKQHDAYRALDDGERRAVDTLLGGDLHLNETALDYFDGDPARLSAADIRSWLEAARQHPFALVGTEPRSPEQKRVFAAVMAALPREDKLGGGGVGNILRAKSLAAVAALAEGERRAHGTVLEEQLASVWSQAQALERTTGGLDLPQVLAEAGLGALADALVDYRRGTTGLGSWLDELSRVIETGAFNTKRALSKILRGMPEHEGRFDGERWHNWSESYSVRPARFAQPSTEAAISELVKGSDKVRVAGAGHSFNDSPLTTGTLISLDKYNQVLEIDADKGVATVQGGIRLRDLNRVLEMHGLALPVLGSTDAQSIAALVATDLHGTGRDHGFLSEQIRCLKVVGADGVAKSVRPGDPLFHATIGGLGTTGVVTEVELSLEPAFRLEKRTKLVDRAWAEKHIDQLLAEHDHVSFYYPAGGEAKSVRMHTWDRTERPAERSWETKMAQSELSDFVFSAYASGLAEKVAAARADAPLNKLLAPEKSVVAPSSRAFGRRLFYRHDEIEFGVPFERYREALRDIMELLKARDYTSIVEVRFTPDRSQGLLGPGVGRRTAYIELATPLSQATAEIYAEVEAIFRRHGGQPHLGKKTNMTSDDMLATYGDRFKQHQAVRQRQDPGGKFMNRFTEQVF